MLKKLDRAMNKALTRGLFKSGKALEKSGRKIKEAGETLEDKGKDLEGLAVMREAEETYKKSQGGAYS